MGHRDDGHWAGMTRRTCLRGLGAGLLALAGAGRLRAAETKGAGRIFVLGRFSDMRDRGVGIFVVDPEAETWHHVVDQRRDADGFFLLSRACVSPDGRTVAFSRIDNDGDPVGVWACDVDGGEPRRLHDHAGGFQGPLLWAGDGKRMLATRRDFNKPEDAEKVGHWVVDLTDGDARRLPIPEADSILDWSADGRRLLVGSMRDRKSTEEGDDNALPLYVMGLDGRDARQIDPGGGGVTFGHRLAPDGRRVCLTRGPADGSGDLVLEIIDVETCERRVVLREREFLVPNQAVWSPDGRRLAVVLSEEPRDEKGERVGDRVYSRLVITDADGRHPRPIRLPHADFLRPIDWR